jgi:hypothetical protein
MAMGVKHPGFQLLSLRPSPSALRTAPCLLPDQLGLYLRFYLPLVLLSVCVVLADQLRRAGGGACEDCMDGLELDEPRGRLPGHQRAPPPRGVLRALVEGGVRGRVAAAAAVGCHGRREFLVTLVAGRRRVFSFVSLLIGGADDGSMLGRERLPGPNMYTELYQTYLVLDQWSMATLFFS